MPHRDPIALSCGDPSPDLYVVGAGHVGQEVARFAHAVGFRVHVIDDREAFANPERFPEAASVHVDAIDGWLAPSLAGVMRRAALDRLDIAAALRSQLDGRQLAELDRVAPTHVEVPTGSRIPVDYSDPLAPVLAVRLQEMFGATATPCVGGGRVPLTLHLLSPAHRPVQVTRDLAGFWASSYFAVRKDLRGRYPRHPWPEDPLLAAPTRRAKPR